MIRKDALSLLLVLFAAFNLVGQTGLEKGLIAFYQMDGDALDQSSFRNDGAMFGGLSPVTDRNGNPCSALSFNGSTGYISVPSSASLNSIDRAFTVAAWVKLSRGGYEEDLQWLSLVCKSNVPEELDNSPHFRAQATRVTLSINTDFTENYAHDLSFDRWYFYSVVYDGQNVKAYLDSREIFSFPYRKKLSPNRLPLEIGRDIPGAIEHYCGAMDDLRIYNRALDAQEIRQLSAVSVAPKLVAAPFECPANIEVECQPGDCSALVNYKAPVYPDLCGDAEVRLAYGQSSGSNFAIGRNVVVYSLKAASKTGTCSFDVTVKGESPNFGTCPNDTLLLIEAGALSTPHNYRMPTFFSQCGQWEMSLVSGLNSGADFPIGKNEIKYVLRSKSGAKDFCDFTVTVKAKEEVAIAPTSADDATKLALPIDTDPVDEKKAKVDEAAKEPEVKEEPAESDIAEVPTIDDELAEPEEIVERIQMICPKNQKLANSKGTCGSPVKFDMPEVTGVLQTSRLSQSAGLASGAQFPVGITAVGFEVETSMGSKANCSFSIEVVDTEKPSVVCPRDINVLSTSGSPMVVDYEMPQAYDNCAGVRLQKATGLNTGERYPVGSTAITYTATDLAGNKRSCSFNVTVDEPAQSNIEIPGLPPLPAKLDGDVVDVQREITVIGDKVRIYLYDHKKQDGDTVSINVDGKWVRNRVLILKKKDKLDENDMIEIELEPNSEHFLITKAWNEGTEPPNTLTIAVYDDRKSPQVIPLESTIGTSAAVRIKRE